MAQQQECCSGSGIDKEKAYREFMNLKTGEQLYREIEIADGRRTYTKIFCKISAEGAIDTIQIGQREEPEGTTIFTGEPMHFENKDQFRAWIMHLLFENFDSSPYITISPMQINKIKEREREHTCAMYW